MPKDNIQRAIKRGTGELEGGNLDEVVYEGYGSGGVAILCEVLTDNRNRTAGEIRKIFELSDGKLGGAGCVAWMFDNKGLFLVPAGAVDEDKLMELALEAGADDVKRVEDKFEVTCDPAALPRRVEGPGRRRHHARGQRHHADREEHRRHQRPGRRPKGAEAHREARRPRRRAERRVELQHPRCGDEGDRGGVRERAGLGFRLAAASTRQICRLAPTNCADDTADRCITGTIHYSLFLLVVLHERPILVEIEIGAVVEIVTGVALLLLRLGLGDDHRLAELLL